ncbi:MAG: DUF4013 domain-containing protein [Desulfobacterota bacterium]|nr:DUF4013 domain-containing protein [Thermodesulfobacteriota bacterium]MDW8002624.1 DUF4013 domain-containing protein [Deltaproteobacteria bacterium]
MNLLTFVRYTFDSKYLIRWVLPGLAIYIPILNFFSIGYVVKMAKTFLFGNIGIPTWENKSQIWVEGLRIVIICVIYFALPSFILSIGYFFSNMEGIVGFIGKVLTFFSYPLFFIFSFPLPFAFSVYAQKMHIKDAFDYEKILVAIKEVSVPYITGFICAFFALFVSKALIAIPYIGFIISSLTTYYTFLLSSYFFATLFKRATL